MSMLNPTLRQPITAERETLRFFEDSWDFNRRGVPLTPRLLIEKYGLNRFVDSRLRWNSECTSSGIEMGLFFEYALISWLLVEVDQSAQDCSLKALGFSC